MSKKANDVTPDPNIGSGHSAGINSRPTAILLKWPYNIVRDRSFDRLFIALSYRNASAYLFSPPIRILIFSSHTGVLMTSTHATV